jgi:amidase
MATRGVGGDRRPETHELTEEKQGRFHSTMGPYSDPVLHIKPGDRVVVQTRDAFEGKITKETDKPSLLLEVPFLNPQNGPIMVEGAQKGDALAVYIESMTPRGENPRGTCCMIPEFGALTGTYYTATLNDPLPEVVRKIDLDEEWVYWSPRVKLPYRPHIGTLSCSPEIDSINSLTPDNHGGNMDPARYGAGERHLFAGTFARRAPVHRRRACLPGRR